MLRSSLCTQASLTTEPLVGWIQRLHPDWFIGADRSVPIISASPVPLHRKLWEWGFIIQALAERDMLRPGRRGLGFGVGHEPLVSFFAGTGCDVIATDQAARRARRGGWVESHQHAAALEELYGPHLCERDDFDRHVSFRPVDMRRIPADLTGFDFTWSSCSLEHLGSIAHAQDFVIDQMRCLAPGGVAVHTTEFKVTPGGRTLARGDTVILRERDVEELAARLRGEGHRVELDLTPGTDLADRRIAESGSDYPHLTVRIGGVATTSLGLIVVKGDAPERLRRRPPLDRMARRAPGTATRLLRDATRGVRRSAHRTQDQQAPGVAAPTPAVPRSA